MIDTPFPQLHASEPEPLPFAPATHIRAFMLERDAGNLLVYAAPSVEALGGVTHQYLNHWHEAAFGKGRADARLVVHEADRAATERTSSVDETFADRALIDGDFELIPTPGHTPGATAFLWHNGEQRVLFTGDSIYLRDGEWVAAMLEGTSDRAAYLESLELIRGLEFDVLLPWAASGDSYAATTNPADTQRRIDAIIERLRRGEDH
jgi:glyoxylase-like metal-dependent hydrolase (beta-lactamase superfamily II)